MQRFLVCIHDATPAWASETGAMIRDLDPLLGRRLTFGVVPDWHGEWPLSAHRDYCRLLRDSAGELLLHGCHHRRQRGWRPISWLAEGSDEMNGLDPDETRRTLDRAQRVFAEVFGGPARGFLAPAWQRGHVRVDRWSTSGLDHILGYFAIESRFGQRVPLATWTWDCGRWRWLGHVGDGIGRLRHSLHRGVPVLAIHPRDVARGFWPEILGLTRRLLEEGYEPSTPADVLTAWRC